MEPDRITVKGAREHNLRGVSLDLPRNSLICFTGVSGSGKSSLAFDTLYAEGQRRYIESLSSYARQFLGQLAKPDVDLITGLSPAISIQQKTSGWNPRSTVGTITQIYDYLRVLFARVGQQHCTQCGRPIAAQTREQIVERILQQPAGTRFLVLAPVAHGQKGEFRDLFDEHRRAGYVRARVDGRVVSLSEELNLGRQMRHDIEIVVDRLVAKPQIRPRLAEAVEQALGLGKGTLIVAVVRQDDSRLLAETLYSTAYACTACQISYEPPSPQLLSFNSPTGMCPTCDGLGTRFDFDPDLLVPDPSKSFLELAIAPMRVRIRRWRRHIYQGVANHLGFSLRTPWKDLPKRARQGLLYGTGETHITFEWRWRYGIWRHGGQFQGVIAELQSKYKKAKSDFVRRYYEQFMRMQRCPGCQGTRLKPQALAIRIADHNIQDVCAMSIAGAQAFFADLKLDPVRRFIAEEILKEIRGRLDFLMNVGLHYLTLDRAAPTLAGGESQRIRLAGQIGCGLVGVLYILDEPSIGLHPRDNRRLLDSLCTLRDMGNTVIVVEHDEATIRTADRIVDFGPGPGTRGGEIVAAGRLPEILSEPQSLTGDYLAGRKRIPVPAARRPVNPPPPRKNTKPRTRSKTPATRGGRD